MDDRELDDLFRAARAKAPVPSPALVARVLADAAAVQPRPLPRTPRPADGGGWIARLAEAFGGRGVLGALAGTAIAGLALGFFGPALVADWPAAGLPGGGLSVELIPDTDMILAALEGQG